jgi:hypothetical protein
LFIEAGGSERMKLKAVSPPIPAPSWVLTMW